MKKLFSIKYISDNSFFVTMEFSFIYSNINLEENAEACFKKS